MEKRPKKAFIIADQNQFKEQKILMMQNQQILLPMYINLKINNQVKNKNMRSVYHVSSRENQSRKKEIIKPQKMGLLVENPVYKPFRYPWCYDAWLTQQRIHWLPEEVPLGDDVRDWQKNLSQSEKNLLTQIFRFFTQADVRLAIVT